MANDITGSVRVEGDGMNIIVDDLTAYVHAAEEGGYWAEVPALPGCLTQGETLDEVVENLNDAIAGWLSVQTPESLRAKGVPFTALPAGTRRAPRVRTLELAA
jgi:predicted RNase H-like HicB family nuclease